MIKDKLFQIIIVIGNFSEYFRPCFAGLSRSRLMATSLMDELYKLLRQGAYLRIYNQRMPAPQWLTDYTTIYIQRDVRQVLNSGEL